ncbi:SH3 domain-containing protein [Bacillus sp. AFS040349]|uniref:SH3 domain-containing protein n=1 Tax=Bacillus sp. AFS040349 TaxID=2033502 RepID=UPI000BFC82B3|nr:SH3 domain-containing protein [Bacillus sp. AFS040349]PGT81919.1 N-acetylmuramoyl-L-alanine amidase [Bacillus sp. AFS040349]
MIRKNRTNMICFILLFTAFLLNSSVIKAENKQVIINVEQNYVRSGAGLTYSVIAKVKKGQTFNVLEKKRNWIKIKLSPTSSGWIPSWFTIKENSDSKLANKKTTHYEVISLASGLRIRSGPGLSFDMIGSFEYGKTAIYLDKSGEWTQILYSGKTGWVSNSYIEKTNRASTRMAKGIVTAPILSIRDKGTFSGKVLSSVPKNTEVMILQEKNNWYKISFKNETGWVAGWFIKKTADTQFDTDLSKSDQTVKIMFDGTNIRSGSSTNSTIVKRVNLGDTFQILQTDGDWYKVALNDKKSGYVAGWVVETSGVTDPIRRPGAAQYVKGKTIVIDPGHGGQDGGAVGNGGTLEKNLTLTTAKLVYDKLKSAGANVFITRSTDTYISLNSRVSTSHYRNAEAFISLHYDSAVDPNASGTSAYFYHSLKDAPLAFRLNKELTQQTRLNDRGVKFGNFHVLRENHSPAVLLELGFLSNRTEELTINSASYQEHASQGIFNGIAYYFK